jgi:protein transport protein SEC24
VEFVAPGDYMVRPPQPPVYFFVIDVSSVSAQSGMLEALAAGQTNTHTHTHRD